MDLDCVSESQGHASIVLYSGGKLFIGIRYQFLDFSSGLIRYHIQVFRLGERFQLSQHGVNLLHSSIPSEPCCAS